MIRRKKLWLEKAVPVHGFFYYIKEKVYKIDNSNPVEAMKPTDIFFALEGLEAVRKRFGMYIGQCLHQKV